MPSSSRRASSRRLVGPLAFAALFALASAAQATAFTSFAFDSTVSTSGAFGGVNGVYGNGDVRLDAIGLGGLTLGQAQLQTVVQHDAGAADGLQLGLAER
ncbi:MAG: hypothetical protein EOP40_10305, partial [Rubrivivax sp.]